VKIVREVLKSPEVARGFILDGFPRTLPQAKSLSRIFEELNIRSYRVIELAVDQNEIVRRLGNRLVCEKKGTIFNMEADGVTPDKPCPDCGARLIQRDDDKEGTVRQRLRVYHQTTSPVLRYYDDLGRVSRVDGSGSVDNVAQEIRRMLDKDL